MSISESGQNQTCPSSLSKSEHVQTKNLDYSVVLLKNQFWKMSWELVPIYVYSVGFSLNKNQ